MNQPGPDNTQYEAESQFYLSHRKFDVMEPLGASLLISATAKYAKKRVDRMLFLDEVVEAAAARVAEDYEALDPDVFPVIFAEDEIIALVEDFEQGGDPISAEDVADGFDEGMLGEEVDATPEELVESFLRYLEQEISQDSAIGNKLLLSYSQRIFEYAAALQEGQEELFELREVVAQDPPTTDYTVFETIDERFSTQFAGDHPTERYDLPFYGRTDEVNEFFDFIESDTAVLIVGGSAGMGKTRLVVEASLQVEAAYPEWHVYTPNMHVGNIDEGLDELDLETEEHVILFVDDARNADQLDRLFDLADRHRPTVKLVFAERSFFVPSLQEKAGQFSLAHSVQELEPLDSDTIRDILAEYHGIVDPSIQDWILNISEGRPQIAHLLADQLQRDREIETSPLAEHEELQWIFDDAVNAVRAAAEQRGLDQQKAERYLRYLAGIGQLDTGDDEFVTTFRDIVSLDAAEEPEYRELLTAATGLVHADGDRLAVQPDVLREHIVYDTFFDTTGRDYRSQIYDPFEPLTGKKLLNTLLTIEHRYGCRAAGEVVEEIIKEHMDAMEEYSLVDRVTLLRRFELLGTAKPVWGIDLVQRAFAADVPETDEEERLQRRILKAPSPAGNLCLAAISILWKALLREPKAATNQLLEMLVQVWDHTSLRDDILQKLRQELEPGRSRDPVQQRQALAVIGEFILNDDVTTEMRLELLDVVAAPGRDQTRDHFMDPVQETVVQFRQAPLPQQDPWQELRLQAVDILIALLENGHEDAVENEAASKLARFYRSQVRYYNDHEVVYNPAELERLFEFVIPYVEEAENLDCVRTFSRWVDTDPASEMDIQTELEELEDALERNELYRISTRMQPSVRDLDEREAAMRTFAQEVDVEDQTDVFATIAQNYASGSLNTFFSIVAQENPDDCEQLLGTAPPGLKQYLPDIVRGICTGDPDQGMSLVSEFVEDGEFVLACAGLQALLTTRSRFARDKIERILDDERPYSQELTTQLPSVLMGYWEEDPAWTEDVVLQILQHATSLGTHSIDSLVLALPHHDDELATVGEAVINAFLEYLAEEERIQTQRYDWSHLVEEAAARSPTRFVEFCLDRYDNGFTGPSLLPSHLDLPHDRMRASEDYQEAVEHVSALIMDDEQYHPLSCKHLFVSFPAADIAAELIAAVPGCDTNELAQILEYCKLHVFCDPIEDILLAVLTESDDDFRTSDAVRQPVISVLTSDAQVHVGPVTDEDKASELDAVQRWQDDPDLPPDVRRFADEAEQAIRRDLDRRDNLHRLE